MSAVVHAYAGGLYRVAVDVEKQELVAVWCLPSDRKKVMGRWWSAEDEPVSDEEEEEEEAAAAAAVGPADEDVDVEVDVVGKEETAAAVAAVAATACSASQHVECLFDSRHAGPEVWANEGGFCARVSDPELVSAGVFRYFYVDNWGVVALVDLLEPLVSVALWPAAVGGCVGLLADGRQVLLAEGVVVHPGICLGVDRWWEDKYYVMGPGKEKYIFSWAVLLAVLPHTKEPRYGVYETSTGVVVHESLAWEPLCLLIKEMTAQYGMVPVPGYCRL